MTHNLPVHLTRFIGREREITHIKQTLIGTRLITLTGPGGCGKTRLAVEVARSLDDEYDDGIYWVELSTLTDQRLVPSAVSRALGVSKQPGHPLEASISNFLGTKNLLLLLDNCEHLVSACAVLVDTLLHASPNLQVLTTSREPLGVAGEVNWLVPSLSVPAVHNLPGSHKIFNTISAPTASAQLYKSLPEYESVSLFLDRAEAAQPGFKLTKENALPIAQICQRLDGIPLAIELASARVNVLTVEQISSYLDNRFELLTSDQRLSPIPRHSTLRAAIDWSYDLLTAEEQLLLQRLAVFEAGCTLDTAKAVCSGQGLEDFQFLTLLPSLVNKSLVVVDTISRAEARYRLLETIREYALEELTSSGETLRLQAAQLNYYVDRAEEIAPKLHGEYQQVWLNWLEEEHDNLRGALSWSLECDHIESGVRLAWALLEFWLIRGHWQEGLLWPSKLLEDLDTEAPHLLQAQANAEVARFSWLLGDYAQSERYGNAAKHHAEAAGEAGKFLLAMLMIGEGSKNRSSGDHQKAFEVYQRSILLYREMNHYSLPNALLLQAVTATSLGEFDQARNLFAESEALFRESGDRYGLAHVLAGQGDVAFCEEHYKTSRGFYQRSKTLYEEIGSRTDIARLQVKLALAELSAGQVKPAQEQLHASLSTQQVLGNTRGIMECLLGVGILAALSDHIEDGVRLLTFVIKSIGESFLFSFPAEESAYRRHIKSAQQELTDAQFEKVRSEAKDLSLEAAIGLARIVLEIKDDLAAPGGLTPRQRQVASLIAEGKTNSEIAAELVISKRTVEKHIANILVQLGFTHRAEIVRWAFNQNLLDDLK